MPSNNLKAGLNKFTKLTTLEEWLIERKVSIESKKVFCRASIPIHSTWYGSRIRLNEKDELFIPSWIRLGQDIKESTLHKVRKSLKDCRKGFLYYPEY